ncbi:hypothetical protein SMD44_07543 [Streptomyces alboflavus]|uniref:Amidase domain-containing protein n=2 Tax=Streptomyces alboflavus TaxID=67267 RepID=A0A1Z1WNP6_9ACTN|nr:hypothetical protein SMD44_07543 [Streptomyces alboflavus]
MPQPLTLSETALALRAGTVTSVGLTEAAIAAADRHDGALGVYLARFDERARAAALRADEELARGLDRGPLHGIPFGVKDTIAVADGPTTAQSLVHDRAWWAGRDAPVVARLRAAGAVITGKTTAMEFGCGLPEEDEPFPFPRNPWRPDLWAGGSSSGSASGVAAGFFTAALGGDTGGSIRMPAAFCGVSGLLPTFGRVPGPGACRSRTASTGWGRWRAGTGLCGGPERDRRRAGRRWGVRRWRGGQGRWGVLRRQSGRRQGVLRRQSGRRRYGGKQRRHDGQRRLGVGPPWRCGGQGRPGRRRRSRSPLRRALVRR